MLNEYGLASTVIGTGGDGNEYNIASPPLSYVRSGYLNQEYDALRYTGYDAYGWSILARPTNAGTYYLSISEQIVDPLNRTTRYDAFPVRCMTIASSGTTTE